MKLTSLNPKRLFRRKDRSAVSRSDPHVLHLHYLVRLLRRKRRYNPNTVLPEVSGDFRGELAQAFLLIDRDNDGIVSVADFQAVLAPLVGSAPPDGGGGGCESVEELANRVGSCCYPEEVRDAFVVFDEDGDGRISAEELLRVFLAIGDERCTIEQCRRMIAGADSNGDGFVCFEDFSRMMQPQRLGECC